MAVTPLFIPPNWVELPPKQQQILFPLAGEWDQLESWRRKKWLDIAERYPSMTADEQARIQRRMKDWVKLSPEERKAARETFKNVQQATPEQRDALKRMWSEYQTLPAEEKQRLKQSADKSTATGKTAPKSSVDIPPPKTAEPVGTAGRSALPVQPVPTR